MRLTAALLVVALAFLAGPARAADCGTIVGWVGVPLCEGEAGGTIPVPNVVGEATSAAADTILEGDGLDLGAVTERCSDEADDEVVGQNPAPGALASPGALVDVLTSNGIECSNGKPGVRLKGLRLRGI